MNLRFVATSRRTSSVTFFMEAIFSISWSESLGDSRTARDTILFGSRMRTRRSSWLPTRASLIFSGAAKWLIFCRSVSRFSSLGFTGWAGVPGAVGGGGAAAVSPPGLIRKLLTQARRSSGSWGFLRRASWISLRPGARYVAPKSRRVEGSVGLEKTCWSSLTFHAARVSNALMRISSTGSAQRRARISIFSSIGTGRLPSAPLRRIISGAVPLRRVSASRPGMDCTSRSRIAQIVVSQVDFFIDVASAQGLEGLAVEREDNAFGIARNHVKRFLGLQGLDLVGVQDALEARLAISRDGDPGPLSGRDLQGQFALPLRPGGNRRGRGTGGVRRRPGVAGLLSPDWSCSGACCLC